MSNYDLSKTPTGFNSGVSGTNAAMGVYIGIVKAVEDTTMRMGRLQVWIPELGARTGAKEDDKRFWYTLSYASPFAGATPVKDNAESAGDYTQTQTSYGFWMVPPDVGNEVLCVFANGDTANGFWIACLYQQHMNHMVPALGAESGEDGSPSGGPVAEYNKKEDQSDYANPMRVPFAPLADGLATQGLMDDPRRGNWTTSSRRESPSRAYGWSTPRGNSVHIDDGFGEDHDNEFIRFRTRSGVGITIHETDGFIYMVSKNGKSYVEIGDDGINLYSESGGVNLRSMGGYNIHSDGDINIDAGGNLNIYASGRIAMGSPGDVHIAAGGNLITGANGQASMRGDGGLLLSSGGIMGLSASGTSIRQGATIQDGIDAPIAPIPLAPERHSMPDGPGGLQSGSSIGSGMPHHEPRSGDGGYGGGGNEPLSPGSYPSSAEKRRLWGVMYAEMRRLGWSDVGAKTMIAQIGRENDYNLDLIYGSHKDPANGQTNGGLISWQRDRRTNMLNYLRSKGALDASGRMKRDDNTIRAQIQFMDQEMKQRYSSSHSAVRSNDGYRSVETQTSNGYVKWARNGARGFSISSARVHLAKMDRLYTTIDKSLSNKAPTGTKKA